MKGLVKATAGPGAELREVPAPQAGSGEVLIRVDAASVCGTDLHIYKWDEWAQSRIRVPRLFGHEFCGTVIATGPGCTRVQVGDFVSAESHIVCGRCVQCRTGQAHVCQNQQIIGIDRDGCFTEQIAVPEVNAWVNPPGMTPEIATLEEPMGNAVHTVSVCDVPGKSVVVFGCGPIGLGAIALCRAMGAARVIGVDLNPYRLDLASKMGAHHAVNASAGDPVATLKSLTDGNGPDACLEMSGAAPAVRQALRSVRGGGKLALLGLPSKPMELDLTNDVIFKGITVFGILGRRMYETWYQMHGFLASGAWDLRPLVTHTFPLEEHEQAFAVLQAGECGKVVFRPRSSAR